MFADILNKNLFDEITCEELVAILSCFTDIKVQDELKTLKPNSDNEKINKILEQMERLLFKYKDFEISKNIQTGTPYDVQFDIIQYSIDWVRCDNEISCKSLLENIKLEKEISIGEFSKAMLKINNIVNELSKIAENNGNIGLLHILQEIPTKTLKFIITNQSLYV
jgi:hypothetical protein